MSATPLDLFCESIRHAREIQPFTERGTMTLQQAISAIAPRLPAILVHGLWYEPGEEPVHGAIAAARHALSHGNPDDESDWADDAVYLTGLCVGLMMASALQGAQMSSTVGAR
jgi:hypothetical protein